jgi:hypothetical protein
MEEKQKAEESLEDNEHGILTSKTIFLYSLIPTNCSLVSISGFIFCSNG